MKYSKDDDQLIVKQSETMSTKQMADYWGVTPNAIYRKLTRLGIVNERYPKWTEKIEKKIIAEYHKKSIEQLIKETGMTEEQIRFKARNKGLYSYLTCNIVLKAIELAKSYELNAVSESVETVMMDRIKYDVKYGGKPEPEDYLDTAYKRLEKHGIKGTRDIERIINLIKADAEQ